MKISAIAWCLLSVCCAGGDLAARGYNAPGGVAVQVIEGDPVPPIGALDAVTASSGDVRDALYWSSAEQSPGAYLLPPRNVALYRQVAQAGRFNVVTLLGCNTLSRYACAGPKSFPQTKAQIDGFANLACWVVSGANIPKLRAVTIWSEMNGDYDGGVKTPAAQEEAMADLLIVVVPAIRACNPNVAIYAGAFVGDSDLASWFCHIQAFGFDWASVDGLDIHPYLTGGPSKPAQNGADWRDAFVGQTGLGTGCGGVTTPIVSPLYFSEWGGPALQLALGRGFFSSAAQYFAWFEKTVANVDPGDYPVVGRAFFLLQDDVDFPEQGLYQNGYASLTSVGVDYRAAYVAP